MVVVHVVMREFETWCGGGEIVLAPRDHARVQINAEIPLGPRLLLDKLPGESTASAAEIKDTAENARIHEIEDRRPSGVVESAGLRLAHERAHLEGWNRQRSLDHDRLAYHSHPRAHPWPSPFGRHRRPERGRYTAAQLLVLLPVLALGACVLALKTRLGCWREAILRGAVLWGTVLVGITELLSVLHSLTFLGLAAAWLVALLIGVAFVVRARGHRQLSVRSSVRLARLDVALLGPLAVLLLVLAMVAVVSPPNTWDSMTYHMARLIHWSQNASLAPYPTHILRQLYLQPGAEFALLHLQVLSGGDRLAGLVQWASMVGVVVGTSLIAHDLGAGRPGALCASILAASLPIGILEATSTQNDYVVAFWDVCVMAFGLRLIRSSSTAIPWATTAAFGASVGLAILTKATAYLLVLPIVLWVTLCLAYAALAGEALVCSW